MSNLLLHVGRKVREQRKIRGLSQAELGRVIKLDPSYLGKIERGEANPTLDTLNDLATALNISPFEFFEAGAKRTYTEKTDLIENITIGLHKASLEHLKVISRIVKDALLLINKK
ncbi:helix-turn-helix domain-containing protein [Cohnella sp. GCM10020058]|uniref:helix-turn-helix domain-containing protein n=1 Tax=Cohnella sp. GCM10020058 TaxID=3317330 RepID=UPI00363CD64A